MAHSCVEAFPTELEVFQAFAEDLPDSTTFLVDALDQKTPERRNAIRAL